MGERPRLISFSPILPVRDLGRALSHYDSLGFTTKAYEDGDAYGFADRDGIGLHLAAEAGHDPTINAGEAYLYVEDADALYAEWRRPGVGGVTRPVGDTPYPMREGSHIDPDGNLLRFGSDRDGGPDPERLAEHLRAEHGIAGPRLTALDQGVFRVDRDGGPSLVARLFPSSRPVSAVAGDAEILTYLAGEGFPAERCASEQPVSELSGRGVLVTEFVDGVERAGRRAAIKDEGGLRRLGEMLGVLQTMEGGPDAVRRPGGAWHHMADGGPADELAAARNLLAGAEGLISADEREDYEAMQAALDGLDDASGLPEALLHPDLVLPNVVPSAQRGMVLVDWTGAGTGPRLWSLAFLLFAAGARDLRRVDRVLAGYRSQVTLEPEELDRLAGVARARPTVLEAWSFCMGRKRIGRAAREAAGARELANTVVARAREFLSA
jgi:Ser/Thr protein kinase RdoA (MazF antagonist)